MPLYLLSLGIKDIQVKIKGTLSGKDLFLIGNEQVCFMHEERKSCSSLIPLTLSMDGWYYPFPHCCSAGSGVTDIGQQPWHALSSVAFIKHHRCAETGPRLLQGQIPWKTVLIRVGGNGWRVDVSPVLIIASVGVSTGTPSSSLTS